MLSIWRRLAFRVPSRNTPGLRRTIQLNIETLECRAVPSFTPNQIAHAYGFDAATIYDGSFNPIAQGDGTGQTIAIVIAYDNPYINSDLTAFDSSYHIPDPPSFQKAYPQGTPAFNSGWAQESALDVEYSHAMAPGANIILVEANSSSTSALFGAVNYARNLPGVSVVSMSWGAGEFGGETSYDSYFTTPSGHNGVSFVASSGDTGGERSYPAMSPYVVSVGGTSLTLSGGEYSRESAWGSSGGGVSAYESQPYWQSDFYSSSQRSGPDVGYVGNPSTGVVVRYHGSSYVVGGTSVGAPQWAGLIAIADQQMNAWGYDTLDGASQTLAGLYGIADWYGNGNYDGADFHDIVGGSAGGHQAIAGYDLATGLGSPITSNLVTDLAYYTAQNIDGGPYIASPPGHTPTLGGVTSSRLVTTSDATRAAELVTMESQVQGNSQPSELAVSALGAPSDGSTVPGTPTSEMAMGDLEFAHVLSESLAMNQGTSKASMGNETSGAMAAALVHATNQGNLAIDNLDILFTADRSNIA